VKTELSNKIKENVLSILMTKENANQFTEFVKFLTGETFGTHEFELERVVKEKYDNNIPFWYEYIERELSKNCDLEHMRKYLLELESVVDNSPIVMVEIPFIPSRDFVTSLFKTIGDLGVPGISKDKFLIEFKLNASIVGGAKLHIGGRYFDLSLKKILVNYLETNNVIKRYL